MLEARWRSGKHGSSTFGWEKVKNLSWKLLVSLADGCSSGQSAAVETTSLLLYLGMRDVPFRGMFSCPVFYVFFTSRLKVNLYAVDEMAFLGDHSKAGLGRVAWCMQALAALLATHQGLGIPAGNAGSAWSGAAQLQGGTANLIAYCH